MTPVYTRPWVASAQVCDKVIVSYTVEMTGNHHRRKKIRLPIEAYSEPGSVWHVTMCAIDRLNSFSNNALAESMCTQVLWYGHRYNVMMHAYCVVPDHLHLIAQVNDQSLIKMLGAFKSFTTRIWWKQGGEGQLWQESFYDHGIRRVEDFDEAVGYLLNNPVRAGLVSDQAEYPWRGGAVFEDK